MRTYCKYFLLFAFGMISGANALTVCAPVSDCTVEGNLNPTDTPDWILRCGVDSAYIKGLGICTSSPVTGTKLPGYLSYSRSGAGSNSHCYCQVIYPYRSKWVHMGQITSGIEDYDGNPIYDPDEDEYACHNECAGVCANEFINNQSAFTPLYN